MLKDRVITALVLLFIFFLTLVASSTVYFAILTLIFVAIAGWEWARLSGYKEGARCLLSVIVIVLSLCMWNFNCIEKSTASHWLTIGIVYFLAMIFFLMGGTNRWLKVPPLLRYILGCIVLTISWGALLASKMQGNNFLLSVLFLVWISDTGAYFAGKYFGKHKLAPSISPGKTWEGVFGALVSVFILAFVWFSFDLYCSSIAENGSLYVRLALGMGVPAMILTLVFLTAVGILGDLFESLMKRAVGLKDSGGALPGHGGVLDRVDALLPVLPFAVGIALALQ